MRLSVQGHARPLGPHHPVRAMFRCSVTPASPANGTFGRLQHPAARTCRTSTHWHAATSPRSVARVCRALPSRRAIPQQKRSATPDTVVPRARSTDRKPAYSPAANGGAGNDHGLLYEYGHRAAWARCRTSQGRTLAVAADVRIRLRPRCAFPMYLPRGVDCGGDCRCVRAPGRARGHHGDRRGHALSDR